VEVRLIPIYTIIVSQDVYYKTHRETATTTRLDLLDLLFQTTDIGIRLGRRFVELHDLKRHIPSSAQGIMDTKQKSTHRDHGIGVVLKHANDSHGFVME
jgi:hypothetical protein